MAARKERSFFQHGMAKWGLFMGFLFLLWFGGWFAFARYADGKIGEVISDLEQRGLIVGCENRDMIGFPFRIGVQCDQTSLASKRDVFRLEAGNLKTAAQLYAPGQLIAELQSPFRTWAGGQEINADWKNLRLFGDVNFSGGFDLISLTGDGLTLKTEQAGVDFKSAGLHLRPTPQEAGSLDLAFDTKGLKLEDNGKVALPLIDFAIDAKLADGYRQLILGRKPLRQMLREGIEVDLRSAVLGVEGDGRIALSGPVSVHEDGTLSGNVKIGIGQPKAVQAWFAKVNPQLARIVGGVAQAVNGVGQNAKFGAEELKSITVQLDRSEIKLGFISLGKIPPLF